MQLSDRSEGSRSKKKATMPKVGQAVKNGRETDETRDAKTGRFLPGNPGGPGRPRGSGRASEIRAILLNTLTDEQATRVARLLIRMAGKGSLAAIRELLDRTIGRPSQTETLERVEALEAKMEEMGGAK
jgi:hypothetical protein